MLSIVYSSTETQPFSNDDLAALLETSRTNNQSRSVTGLLLYKDGQFMQTLEGDEVNVREAIEVISADPRHTDVKVLLETQIDKRQFEEWTMGFRLLSDEALEVIPGYNDFFDPERDRSRALDTPSRARWLMEWFRLHKL